MLLLGSVIHQEQQVGGGKALRQAVQERLGLGIDPVQVLEHYQERPDLALPQEQPLDPVERPLATLRGVESRRHTLDLDLSALGSVVA